MIALETPELPSWAMAIPLALVAIPVLVWVVRNRRRSAQQEVARLGRLARLPDPGQDTAWVVERLGTRHAGRVLGVAAVGVLAVVAASIMSTRGDFPVWIILLMPVGQAVGTAIGNLLRLSRSESSPRVAALHRRELTDYLAPAEIRSAQIAGVLPLVAIVMGAVTLTTTSTRSSALIVVAAGVASLAAGAGTWWLIRHTLAQPTEVTMPAGLQWSEVVRAGALRDLMGAATMFAAWGGGGAILWGIVHGWSNYPDWFFVVGALVGIAAAGLTVASITAGVQDKHFDRVRRETVAEVAP